MSDPVLTTTLFHHGSREELRRTIESYQNTVSVPHELTVVDLSGDDSTRDELDGLAARFPELGEIELAVRPDRFDVSFDASRADYLLLSDTGVTFREGWIERAMGLFDAFSNLGQLSLHGPVPADGESVELRPSRLRYEGDAILYEADGPIRKTSVVRRDVWARTRASESAVSDHSDSTAPGEFSALERLAGELSATIRESGHLVAWAEADLVDPRTDRSSSPETTDRSTPVRRSFLYGDLTLSAEKSRPSPECSEPHLWSMLDGNTAEVETLEFVYSLTRLLKPRLVVETGTWHGRMAEVIGRALVANGRGRLVTAELDPECARVARERIEAAGLGRVVDLRTQSSLDVVVDAPIDLAIFDSEIALRIDEFEHYRPRLAPGATVLFHDAGIEHVVVRADVEVLRRSGLVDGVFLPSPRGLAVCQYRNRRSLTPFPVRLLGWKRRWARSLASIASCFRPARGARTGNSKTGGPS